MKRSWNDGYLRTSLAVAPEKSSGVAVLYVQLRRQLSGTCLHFPPAYWNQLITGLISDKTGILILVASIQFWLKMWLWGSYALCILEMHNL
jgi:hypothetical protein